MNAIAIVPFTSVWTDLWDEFIRNSSRNGTIFHERRFLSYHGPRFEDCSILVVDAKDDAILAVCPAAFKDEQGVRGVVSHPGSTYGGVIFRDDLKTQELKAILEVIISHYNGLGARFFRLILQEEFPTGRTTGELTYLLWHRGFGLAKEASSFVDLHSTAGLTNFRKTTSQYIRSRKGERLGLEHHLATDDALITQTYACIANNLSARHGKSPTHSLEELLVLRKLYPDRIGVFCTTCSGKVISAVVAFELDKQVVHDFYIAQDYEYTHMSPLIGLFMYIFAHYAAKGFDYFNFVISSRGRWIKWGILNFKEQFGARMLTRDVWSLSGLEGKWPYDGAPT